MSLIGHFESSLQSFTTSDGDDYYINFEFENEQAEPSYPGGVTYVKPVYVIEIGGVTRHPGEFEASLSDLDRRRLRDAMIAQAESYLAKAKNIY